MKVERLSGLVAAVCAAAVLAGCGSSTESKASEETPKATGTPSFKIAVIPKGTTHEFWKAIHAGAKKAASELGVEVIWKGPVKEDDRESQIAVIEDFITRGVDGIVVAPLDSSALVAPIEEAIGKGIPVVIIDSGLNSDKYVSFVATDNYKGGKLGGEHLAKLLGGKGRVVLLRYQVGSASTQEREKGFLDAMKENPGITVVSDNQYGGATTETAQRAAENLLAPLKKPDGTLSIDGIFCPNESTTVGMLRVLQDAGLAGKVKFVGFDSSPTLIAALEKGQIHGLVLQNPFNMGYLGVKTMVSHLKKESVEKRIDTGATLATPENRNNPEIRQLLEPPRE
ncbi:MAG TPA: sugar ABC transporter substrate-binding protein [Armatimonadetes bacterium]|nr:sugar ABC transporter substrate-binding protein [Armatimonadota bacterium]